MWLNLTKMMKNIVTEWNVTEWNVTEWKATESNNHALYWSDGINMVYKYAQIMRHHVHNGITLDLKSSYGNFY